MEITNFELHPIDSNVQLAAFDCGDSETNDFLKVRALDFNTYKIASTYLFMEAENIVAFFTISNNCLKDLGEDKGYDKKVWKRFHKKVNIPHVKQIKQYPAILVGRLGVDKKFQRTGIAYQLLTFIKGWVLTDHKPACRFLILDAYNQEKQIKYYTKNEFLFLLDNDEKKNTRLMYFDMLRLED